MSCAVHEWYLDHLNKDGDALGNKGKGKINGEGKNDKGKKCKCKGPVSATGEEGRKFAAAWLTDLKEWRAKSKTQHAMDSNTKATQIKDEGELNQRPKSKTQYQRPRQRKNPRQKQRQLLPTPTEQW